MSNDPGGRASRAREQTTRVRERYNAMASTYDQKISVMEWLLFGDGRRWVCSQAYGDVLEIAVGTGRNLPFYPTDIRLTGIELSPAMLALAQRRAREIGRDANLRLGDGQALDFPDRSFDSVVCTLALCTIPDDRLAVEEIARVLRPTGRFVAMEHVRSSLLPVRLLQRLLDPLAMRFETDHLLREPLRHVEAIGFEVECVERSKWGIVERIVARKPADPDAIESPSDPIAAKD